MTKYGLRAKVITLTLAPTLIIGILLSVYFIHRQYQDLEERISLTGQAIIEPLAIASEIGLSYESRESVRRLVGHAHRQHSQYVRTIAVFSAENELFVTSNYHRDLAKLTLPAGKPLPRHLEIYPQKDTLLLYAPIRVIGGFNGNITQEKPIGYIAMEMDLTRFKLEKYEEVVSAGVVLIFGIILSMIFAYRLLLDVEIPINQMISMIDKIRRGHLNVRIEGNLLDKLDTLKNGINAMAVSLSQYHLEMQQSIDQATSDLRGTLEQLEIQNIELDIAKKHAQEATKVKSEFIANMSHELRTPLNSVLGFTRQILKTQLTNNQQDHLQTIEKSANSLLSIINDILDFSKLEANKLLLEKIPFDLEDTLDEVMQQLALMAHEKGLELYLHIDPKIPIEVMGDPQRIQQVLTNLISNAAKFTEHGHISVRVELKQENDDKLELEFVIQDTGIGISETQQAHLFQAFRQADASINRRYGGTGLGLVITQKLIHQMGGEVGLSSHLHRGSSFWFTLPLFKTHFEAPRVIHPSIPNDQTLMIIDANNESRYFTAMRLTQVGLSITSYSTLPENHAPVLGVVFCVNANNIPPLNTLIDLIEKAKTITNKVIFCLPTTELALFDTLLKAGASACLATPLSTRKLIAQFIPSHFQLTHERPILKEKEQHKAKISVLALDDNPANLKLISTLLYERVTHVLTDCNGLEAVRHANEQKFDLILMDIQMPELDGLAASKEIRKSVLNAHTPIIAVTAHAHEGERERLISEGMNDYITKPIDEQMLERILYQWTKPSKDAPLCLPAMFLESAQKYEQTRQTSIDWAFALKQAGGKEDLAKEMLHMLIGSFEEVESSIQQAMNTNEAETDLLSAIHKLHGSCAYCGVPRLKKQCYELESLLKQGKRLEEIEPELFELLDEMENVKTHAPHYISKSCA